MKKTEAIPTVGNDLAPKTNWWRLLSFQNVSAVYIFLVIFVVFAAIPKSASRMWAGGFWAGILDSQSFTVLAAIAVLIPLVGGVFNLAIGAEISWAVMLCSVLITSPTGTSGTSTGLLLAFGLPWGVAAVITIVCGGLIGMVSGLVITRLKIDSFIATLGMSSILMALTLLVSGNKPLTLPLGSEFHQVSSSGIPFGGFTLTTPVIVMIVISVIIWYWLERTPVGRRIYAAGFNPDGARLSGVKVPRLQLISLVVGGAIAGTIGVLAASRFGGTPGYGTPLLVPALSAVFLGSTQFRGGRFNVWGTVLAFYVLAFGVQNFLDIGADTWLSDLFYGVALIGAVALSRWERTSKRTRAIRQATTFTRAGKEKLAVEAEEEAVQDEPQLAPTTTALAEDTVAGETPAPPKE